MFLHASLIGFNTPDAAVKARFGYVMTLPFFLIVLGANQDMTVTKKFKKEEANFSYVIHMLLHKIHWRVKIKLSIIPWCALEYGAYGAVSIMYSFLVKGITNVFLDILYVYCIS